MKVAELVAAFQRITTTQNNADGATAGAPGTPRRELSTSVPAEARAPQPVPETSDQITVSPEAVFTFAISRFDPGQISRKEVETLADTLYDGGAISHRDRGILASKPDGRTQSAIFEINPSAPTNLITEFQGRLSFDLAHSNINAVEEDTRALSILGRLNSIRAELSYER